MLACSEQSRQGILPIKAFYDQHQHEVTRHAPRQGALTRLVQTISADFAASAPREWIRDPETTKELAELWLQYENTPFLEPSPTPAAYHESTIAPTLAGGHVKTVSKLYAFSAAVRSVVQDRQLVVTNFGRVGLLPAVAQPGGCIVSLAGTGVPFVTRQTGWLWPGRQTWYIIGDCCLNGVMCGGMFGAGDADPYETLWRYSFIV